MFWNRTSEPRCYPASIATRLSVWYACSAFLLLAIGTGFLYWVLVRSFERENRQYLTEKLTTLATLLTDHPDEVSTLEWEVKGESLAHPSIRVLSRVLAPTGATLIETQGMFNELPSSAFSDRQSADSARAVEMHSPAGRSFLSVSANVGARGATGQPHRIQVAIDLTGQQELLAEYRLRMWSVLVLGLLASVFVGWRIARHGIAPIETITAAMRRIRSTNLEQRVQQEGLPGEVQEVAGTFNDMLDRLEDAFSRLSRFSSDIAHELRTPVNNLRGEVEVALARLRSPEEYREVLGSLAEDCERLARLIDSLLFLARADHPETQIRREQLDVVTELGRVREFYEPAAAEAGIILRSYAEGSLSAFVDRTLFQRALCNLVENAVAHTPGGGQVEVSASAQSGNVVISVKDTGAGIAPQHLPRLFDRFYRVDAARTSQTGGTGLGLAIVQSIARLHGGSVGVDSEVGRGTSVTVRFPLSENPGNTNQAIQLAS